MQTFLPYASFERTASVLDYRRLGKQRVEVMQILNSLNNGGGWRNHPAVLMWSGYENALAAYGNAIIQEWVERGYRNNMEFFPVRRVRLPPWIGSKRFHNSHRSNLLRKHPDHYRKYWPKLRDNLPYVWPTSPSDFGPIQS